MLSPPRIPHRNTGPRLRCVTWILIPRQIIVDRHFEFIYLDVSCVGSEEEAEFTSNLAEKSPGFIIPSESDLSCQIV